MWVNGVGNRGRDGKNTENPSRLSILLPWFLSSCHHSFSSFTPLVHLRHRVPLLSSRSSLPSAPSERSEEDMRGT